jgi:hypothetical protein
MKKENFNHLVGKTRGEVKTELGDGFNYFTNQIWTYEIGKTWIGKRIILSVTFKDGKVSSVEVHNTFRKC